MHQRHQKLGGSQYAFERTEMNQLATLLCWQIIIEADDEKNNKKGILQKDKVKSKKYWIQYGAVSQSSRWETGLSQ